MSSDGTERFQIPYEDWEDRFMKYDGPELCAVCRTLSSGDQVIVNKREQTLRVRSVEDCRDLEPVKLGDTGYALNIGPDGFCVHLEGNGTRYEIHVPPESSSNKSPYMYWPSGEQIVGYLDVIVDGEVYEPQVRSSVTASDLLGGDLR